MLAGKPLPYVELYSIAAVFIVRTEPTADASLAAMRERIRLGIAIAAMIKIIATTISNSINEKPFCVLFICFFSPRPEWIGAETFGALAGSGTQQCKCCATAWFDVNS